jgi:hypothetical protein
MKRIGAPSLNFWIPALVHGQLASLDAKQFAGRWMALRFLPLWHTGRAAFLDHQADGLDQIDMTLLVVSSGVRPLHR